MFGWCWASVVDGGSTSTQHWNNVSCLLDMHDSAWRAKHSKKVIKFTCCIYHVYMVHNLTNLTFFPVAYYCARNNLNRALTDCMRDGDYDVSTLIDQTYTYENQDNVAAVSNMQDDRVFIWTGEIDSIVNPSMYLWAFTVHTLSTQVCICEQSLWIHCQPKYVSVSIHCAYIVNPSMYLWAITVNSLSTQVCICEHSLWIHCQPKYVYVSIHCAFIVNPSMYMWAFTVHSLSTQVCICEHSLCIHCQPKYVYVSIHCAFIVNPSMYMSAFTVISLLTQVCICEHSLCIHCQLKYVYVSIHCDFIVNPSMYLWTFTVHSLPTQVCICEHSLWFHC